MQDIHAHAILDMMQGNSYTRESLYDAIISRFGADTRFHTCSVSGLDANEIIDFLTERGKFMPATNGFTVDDSKRCHHDEK